MERTAEKGDRGLQFSWSVESDSLQPHGLQHARPPCLSPTPGVCSDSYLSSRWCHPTISSSVILFSCLQSFPASGSFPMSQFFASGGQSVGISASASVLPMSIQEWFPLGLTGLISLQSKVKSIIKYLKRERERLKSYKSPRRLFCQETVFNGPFHILLHKICSQHFNVSIIGLWVSCMSAYILEVTLSLLPPWDQSTKHILLSLLLQLWAHWNTSRKWIVMLVFFFLFETMTPLVSGVSSRSFRWAPAVRLWFQFALFSSPVLSASFSIPNSSSAWGSRKKKRMKS